MLHISYIGHSFQPVKTSKWILTTRRTNCDEAAAVKSQHLAWNFSTEACTAAKLLETKPAMPGWNLVGSQIDLNFTSYCSSAWARCPLNSVVLSHMKICLQPGDWHHLQSQQCYHAPTAMTTMLLASDAARYCWRLRHAEAPEWTPFLCCGPGSLSRSRVQIHNVQCLCILTRQREQ